MHSEQARHALTAEGAFLVTGVDEADLDTTQDLLVRLDGAADGVGALVVMTGTTFGPVSVTVSSVRDEPDVDEMWEDVVEVSVNTSSGLDLNEIVEGRVATIEANPGRYRIRISCRGRSESAAAGEQYGRRALEQYLIEVWPAPAQVARAVRLSSTFAHTMVHPPPPPPELPERAAGLVGSTAIGRDLDGGLGARTLTGELGSARASRTIPGTRRRIWAYTAVGPHFTAPSTQSGYFPDTSVGSVFEFSSHRDVVDGGDGITGNGHRVRLVFTVSDPPRRQVKTWNWVSRVGAVGAPGSDHHIPFLASDSTVTLEFSESKGADGTKVTTIDVVHTAVPVEWVDDLTAWWCWNLARAEELEIGRP